MPIISPTSQAAFIVLVVIVALVFIMALHRAGERFESKQTSLRWLGLAILLVVVWLGSSALIAQSGLLTEIDRRPPPFLLLAGSFFLATLILAFSPVGTRLINGIGIGWLIGFQVFRLPLEIWLHKLYQAGVIPVQMTYEGRNFDIVTGIMALLVCLWAMVRQPPRLIVWLFNLVGFALLVNIVTIAILSAPTPYRHFFNEPANTFVAYWPYVWLPAFLVQAAWFGHLLVFRWLRRRQARF